MSTLLILYVLLCDKVELEKVHFPNRITFILDVSGSMNSSHFEVMANEVSFYVNKLNSTDCSWVQIILFNDYPTTVYELGEEKTIDGGWFELPSGTLPKSLYNLILTRRGNGGTSPYDAINEVITYNKNYKDNYAIILVSDGLFSNEEEKLDKTVPVFTICAEYNVGAMIKSLRLKQLCNISKQTNGVCLPRISQ